MFTDNIGGSEYTSNHFNPLSVAGQIRLARLLKEGVALVAALPESPTHNAWADNASLAMSNCYDAAEQRASRQPSHHARGRVGVYVVHQDDQPPSLVESARSVAKIVRRTTQTVHNVIGKARGAWAHFAIVKGGETIGIRVRKATVAEIEAGKPEPAKPEKTKKQLLAEKRARDREEDLLARQLLDAPIMPKDRKSRTGRSEEVQE